jgi:hypothetical protein
MKHKSTSVFWMSMAFGVALGLAAAVLAINGANEKSLRMALRLTARWSFLLFWAAYAGRAMSAFFGPVLAPLARRGREFGLAYAAAQLIHVGLVVWLIQITSRLPLSAGLVVFFTIGIVWTYLLAVLSFGGLTETLGARGWRTLRIVGLNYILFVFAYDFVPKAMLPETAQYGGWYLAEYVILAAMCVAAPLLVLTAAAHRQLGMRHSRAGIGVSSIEPIDERTRWTA